jgi:hypothetical protein
MHIAWTKVPSIPKSVFEKFLDLGRRVCVTMNVDAVRVAGVSAAAVPLGLDRRAVGAG